MPDQALAATWVVIVAAMVLLVARVTRVARSAGINEQMHKTLTGLMMDKELDTRFTSFLREKAGEADRAIKYRPNYFLGSVREMY